MLNNVSSVELSCQLRLIWLEESAEATRPLGAAGGVGCTAGRGSAKLRMPSKKSTQIRSARVSPKCEERVGVEAILVRSWIRWIIGGGVLVGSDEELTSVADAEVAAVVLIIRRLFAGPV